MKRHTLIVNRSNALKFTPGLHHTSPIPRIEIKRAKEARLALLAYRSGRENVIRIDAGCGVVE